MIARNKEKVSTTNNSEMDSTVSINENSPYYSFIPSSKTTSQTTIKKPITNSPIVSIWLLIGEYF